MANCVTTFHKEFEERTNTTSGLQAAYDDPHYFFQQFDPRFLDELCQYAISEIGCLGKLTLRCTVSACTVRPYFAPNLAQKRKPTIG